MTHEKVIEETVFARLTELDFAHRYYAYCQQFPINKRSKHLSEEELEQALDELELEHFSKEKFYRFEENAGPWLFQLHFAYSSGSLELGVYAHHKGLTVGGAFHGLARTLMQSKHPGYEHKPRYPRLHPSSSADAKLLVAFGSEVYEAIKADLIDLDIA